MVATLVDTVKQKIVRPRGGGRQLISGEAIATNLMHGDWLYWPSLAFRTDKIREVDFRDGFPIIQDLALIMDMIYKGDQLLIEPAVCFRYRRHSNSASSDKADRRFTVRRRTRVLRRRGRPGRGAGLAPGGAVRAAAAHVPRPRRLAAAQGSPGTAIPQPSSALVRHSFGK